MKLKQGHCVATAAINKDNFHLILAAFRASGCLVTSGFTIEGVKCFKFLEWHNNCLVKTNKPDCPEMLLTVEQILGTADKPHFDFSRRPDSGENDWHERGELPPVGTECEYYRCEHNDWKSCRIEFIGRRVVVMSGTNGSEFCRKIAKLKFRPLKTERERAIEEMRKVVTGLKHDVCGALYDAGFRKEGK